MPDNDHRDHDHPHAPIDNSERLGYYEVLEIAIRELLPQRPAGTEHFSEEELAALVTRDAMIGVTIVESPGLENH